MNEMVGNGAFASRREISESANNVAPGTCFSGAAAGRSFHVGALRVAGEWRTGGNEGAVGKKNADVAASGSRVRFELAVPSNFWRVCESSSSAPSDFDSSSDDGVGVGVGSLHIALLPIRGATSGVVFLTTGLRFRWVLLGDIHTTFCPIFNPETFSAACATDASRNSTNATCVSPPAVRCWCMFSIVPTHAFSRAKRTSSAVTDKPMCATCTVLAHRSKSLSDRGNKSGFTATTGVALLRTARATPCNKKPSKCTAASTPVSVSNATNATRKSELLSPAIRQSNTRPHPLNTRASALSVTEAGTFATRTAWNILPPSTEAEAAPPLRELSLQLVRWPGGAGSVGGVGLFGELDAPNDDGELAAGVCASKLFRET
mmetsp:Transcript_13576/g.50806  ORF Transcript_13576/g.50806 Transcript_13576/m.50806 type:complete len:375 (+) Transcript_13576:736-1860(+)